MNSLGVYFGSKIISIIETSGKKLVNNVQVPQPTSSSSELQEISSPEVKAVEIIALLKSELRRNRINVNEATLCLPGKDLIIRTFEMPSLPHEELRDAVNFEAKKYIPFKIEELISDFQTEPDKARRTNLVLFMGIKKDSFDKYMSIFNQLNIKIRSMEYSAFSILRCLKLTGLSDNGVIGIVSADLHGEDEVNFSILENGLPLFSRDITLSGTPGDLGGTETAESSNTALEKLKTEIRVSLDYYHRKFSAKNIQKIFFTSNQEYRSDLEAFMVDIGISARFMDIAKVIGKQVPYSSGFMKGYSASLSKVIKTKVRLNILSAKVKTRLPKEKGEQTELSALLEGLKLDFRVAALSVLICLSVFGYGFYRTQLLNQDLNNIMNMRPVVSTVSAQADYNELSNKNAEYKRKLNNLDNVIKKQLYITAPLNTIAQIIPTGVWLKSFSFNKDEKEKTELILQGVAYLGDGDKEFEAVNTFLSKLKQDPTFNKYFRNISIASLDRSQLEDVTVTNFYISCKN